MMNRLPALSGLLATLLLLTGTTALGLLYGTGLYDRVVEYLDVVEGELLTVSAIQHENTIHVRANFKHIMGAGVDRIAVSELILGNGHIELTSPLDSDHARLNYNAFGFRDGTTPTCSVWNVTTTQWSVAVPAKDLTTPSGCDMYIYQRGGGVLDDGASVVLEFVIKTHTRLPIHDTSGALIVEFGNLRHTKLTNDAGVSVYRR